MKIVYSHSVTNSTNHLHHLKKKLFDSAHALEHAAETGPSYERKEGGQQRPLKSLLPPSLITTLSHLSSNFTTGSDITPY